MLRRAICECQSRPRDERAREIFQHSTAAQHAQDHAALGSPHYAELALAAGVRLDVVSRQLGHASIATTENVYAHDNDEAATEAAAMVAAALGAAP